MGQEWSRKVSGNIPERKYTPQETLKYMRELIKIDEEYCKCAQDGVSGFLAFRMADMNKPEEVRAAVADPEYVRLSGSCADGGAICRWFRTGIPDVEIDITYQVGIITPDKEPSIIADIPEKPGFIKIYNCNESYNCLHPILRRDRPELSRQFNTGRPSQTYVNTIDMQDDISAIWPHQDGESAIKNISSVLMGVDESLLQDLVTEKVQGPSNSLELILSLRGEPAIAYSQDGVLSIKVEKIPALMDSSWKRLEKILPQATLDELKRVGTQLVAKKSPGASTAEEWRRSTSGMEYILMKEWNRNGKDQKMLCYFTLKCLYYRYVRGIEIQGEHMPSYVLKTAMLWNVEETDESVWSDDNFMLNLKKVLDRLINDLQKRKVPNYFIPQMNVIDPSEYPEELIAEVIKKLKEISNDLKAFLPMDLEKMIQQGQAIISGIKSILVIFKYMTKNAERKHRRATDSDPLAEIGEYVELLNGAGVNVPGFLMNMFNKEHRK